MLPLKFLRIMTMISMAVVGLPATAASLNVLGFDDMSCSAWGKSKSDPDARSAYVVWVRGFLTGHNYALPGQQVATISSGTVDNKLTQYCSQNPGGTLSDAAMRMSDELSGRNQPVRK